MWQGMLWDQNLSHWSCRAIIDGVWRNSAQNGCKFIVPSICFILFPILAVTGSSLWKLRFLNLSPLASVRARFNWMSVKIYGSNAIFRRVLSSWRGCVCRKVGRLDDVNLTETAILHYCFYPATLQPRPATYCPGPPALQPLPTRIYALPTHKLNLFKRYMPIRMQGSNAFFLK